MSDGKTGKGMFGSLLGDLLGVVGPGDAQQGMVDVRTALPVVGPASAAILRASAMQAEASDLQAQYQAYGSGILGVAPAAQPRLSVSDAEIAWVWKALPTGTVLHVGYGTPFVVVVPPEGGAVAWTELSRIPCLRAAHPHVGLSVEELRGECEAAVKLLSLLAYGQPDALSVVVLEKLT